MKLNYAAFALLLCGALCCSDSYGNELLGRMMGRGCGADAVPTCCDAPAAAFGGRSFASNACGMRRGFLGGRCGRGIGCGSYATVGCGCNDVMSSTGCCDPCQSGLFNGRVRGRMGGLCNRGRRGGGMGDCCDPCCDAGMAAPGCGCDAACDPCASGGLLSGMGGRFRGRFAGIGCGTGCDMGCDAPIAAGCGCNDGGFFGGSGCCGRNRGGRLRSRFGRGGIGFDACGCDAAPMAAGCGCNDGGFGGGCGCGSGGRRVGLLDRLRSNRNACCFDQCCSDGMVVAGANCGCNGVGGYQEHHHNGHSNGMEGNGHSNGNGVVAPPDGETSQIRTPRIDPNAFIIRNAGHRN